MFVLKMYMLLILHTMYILLNYIPNISSMYTQCTVTRSLAINLIQNALSILQSYEIITYVKIRSFGHSNLWLLLFQVRTIELRMKFNFNMNIIYKNSLNNIKGYEYKTAKSVKLESAN